MNIARTLAPAAAATLTAVLVATASPALAKDGDVIRSGACSSGSGTSWKLKASPENGRIEVEAEIDSNRNGQVWAWTMSHNGTGAIRGAATTKAPSGSFEVRRVLANFAGRDTFAFTATRRCTTQVCRALVRF